jgi:hypothetical protein
MVLLDAVVAASADLGGGDAEPGPEQLVETFGQPGETDSRTYLQPLVHRRRQTIQAGAPLRSVDRYLGESGVCIAALAMTTTGHRAAAGGLPPPFPARRHQHGFPLRPQHTGRVGAPAGDHGVVPSDAEGAEERHVGLVERLGAREL